MEYGNCNEKKRNIIYSIYFYYFILYFLNHLVHKELETRGSFGIKTIEGLC